MVDRSFRHLWRARDADESGREAETVSCEDQLHFVLAAQLVSVIRWQKQEQIVVRRGGAGCRPRPYQSHVYDNCDECEELLCFSQQLSWQKIFHYKLITTILSVLSVLCPGRCTAAPCTAFHIVFGSSIHIFVSDFDMWRNLIKQTTNSIKIPKCKEKDLK